MDGRFVKILRVRSPAITRVQLKLRQISQALQIECHQKGLRRYEGIGAPGRGNSGPLAIRSL